MRHLYSLGCYLAAPLVLMRLLWRSRKAPAYRLRWAERFGFCKALPQHGCIWLHAVSVGEVRAAMPLIRALQERYRNIPLLVTTTTVTGSNQVRSSLRDGVYHVYLPYDLPDAVGRFLLRTRPRLGIIMETEIWPNLFHACSQAGIPLMIANARLSERSARRYTRFASLIGETLNRVTLVAAQSRSDAIRFNDLGVVAERLRVTGNIKYDLTLPEGLIEQGLELRGDSFGSRPVLVAASTHEGEEEQILDAFATLRSQLDNLLLLLVPRHPERFDEVAELCRRRGLRLVKRSDQKACSGDTEVFLGDSMGELLLFYAAADVAFVGGSLVHKGGHNILEPALLGLPVIFGPHMFNFAEASQHLLRQQAAWQVSDSDGLAAQAAALLRNRGQRKLAGQRGRSAVENNRGALSRLFEMAESLIEANKASPQPRLRERRVGRAGSAQPRSH